MVCLGRATSQRVRQNLAWASAYNLGLLPMAALGLLGLLGLLSPLLAGLAMAFSAAPVLGNAMRGAREA